MNRKTLNFIVTASIVAVLFAGTVIVRSINDKKEEIESNEESPLLSNIEKIDLRRIEIQNSDGAFEFTSNDGKEWTAAPPTKYFQWDKDKIDELVDTAAKLKSLRSIEKSPKREKLDEYGLAHPEATLVLHDSRELKISLLVGIDSPVGSGRYASNDSGEVFLISQNDADSMLRKVNDYRDLSLPSVSADADSVNSLEYKRSGETVKIVKEEDSLVMLKPWRAEVDKTLFNNITGSGTKIPQKVDEYKDQFARDAPFFGLNQNADYLIVEDDEDNVLNIVIGGQLGGGQRYGIAGDGEGSVFLINSLNLSIMDTQPFDFIRKSIVNASLDDVSEISVNDGEKKWEVKERVGGFSINGQNVSEADILPVYEKLTQVVRHAIAPEIERTGKPDVEITIKSKNGSRTIELRPHDESSYAASISGNDVDFLITREHVNFFIEELNALASQE